MEKIENEIGLYRHTLANGDKTYYFTFKDTFGKIHYVKVGRHSEGYRIADARSQRVNAISKNRDKPEALLIKKKQKKKGQDNLTRYKVSRKYHYSDEKQVCLPFKNFRNQI